MGNCGRRFSPPPAVLPSGVLEPFSHGDRTKSEMTAGMLVSKPTTSSMPPSFGSARVKPLEVMPTTTALAVPTRLVRISKKVAGLPRDLAEQHDHYLYGTPKR